MLVKPRDVERLAGPIEAEGTSAFARHHAKAFRLVESVNPVQRRELEPRLAGVGIELQRSGTNDCVIGDELPGFEIALDAFVLHELDVAEVREALTADRITRGIDANLDVDAGQSRIA